MARKIIVKDTDADRFGIRVSYPDGGGGWIAGTDGGYLTFATQKEAEKALRNMRRTDHYSWNCDTRVEKMN